MLAFAIFLFDCSHGGYSHSKERLIVKSGGGRKLVVKLVTGFRVAACPSEALK